MATPTNLAEGLQSGFKQFGRGLLGGITGVVKRPLEGARTRSLGGFGKGLGKGIIGAVVQPLAGATGGIARVCSSILHATPTVVKE